MQFFVIAVDNEDEAVSTARTRAKADHLAVSAGAIGRGQILLEVDILDHGQNVRGSAMLVDFPSLDAVDNWIAREPYVTEKAWSKVEVYPCRIGTRFRQRPIFAEP